MIVSLLSLRLYIYIDIFYRNIYAVSSIYNAAARKCPIEPGCARERLLLTCVQKLSQSTIYILFVPIRLNLYARKYAAGELRPKDKSS